MRQRLSLMMTTLPLIAGLLFGISTDARASYIDPGSGSYLFQMAIAGIVGGLFAFRGLWERWLDFLSRRGNRGGE